MDGIEEDQYLLKSQFAAMMGWSPSYITKLKKQGRLTFSPDGKRIAVRETLKALKHTADPAKEYIRDLHAFNRAERDVGHSSLFGRPGVEGESRASDPKYWENKTRREGALAMIAELELEEKSASLVERDRVFHACRATIDLLTDRFLKIPAEMSHKISGMTDPWAVERELREVIRQTLNDVIRLAN